MALRQILTTILGKNIGLEDGGALILNKRNGRQVILDESSVVLNSDGTTAAGFVTADTSGVLSASGSPVALETGGGLYNFKRANYPNARKGLSNVRIGAANATVLCIGDSLTAGSPGSVATTWWSNSYVARLAAELNTTKLPCSSANWMGNHGADVASSTLSGIDSRILALPTGWSEFSSNGVGGRPLRSGSATSVQTFTPGGTYDTVDVYYWDIAGNDVAVVGGGSNGTTGGGTISVTSTNLVKKATITQATTTVWGVAKQNVNSNPLWIQGMQAYTAATKEVQFINCGIGGAYSSQWVDASNFWSPGAALFATGSAFKGVPLAIINLGTNDAANSVAIATTKANIQTLITNFKAGNTDVLLVMPNPAATGSVSAANYTALRTALYDLALTNNLALVDVSNSWVSFAAANALSYYGDGALHPSAVGYQDIASLVARFFAELSY